jgi:DNA-binding CsgD family transcriptional regulator
VTGGCGTALLGSAGGAGETKAVQLLEEHGNLGEPHLVIERLVRQLAAATGTAVPVEIGGSEILLDVEVDGRRCVLVRSPVGAAEDCAVLSPREDEIARMVAKGYTNRTIAAVLDISSWTVSTHLRRIFGKLGVNSRAAMVARLLEQATPAPADGPARGREPTTFQAASP